MFNLQHILYMVISAIITALLLWLCAKKVKTQWQKDLILKLSAIVTVIVHISDAYVNFFKNAALVYVDPTHIFPIFPCNIIMWMLLIVAFTENKNGRFFKLIAEFCFTIGTACGVIGILLNMNFAANPTLLDYGVFKGLLSHSTMLFGCIYLFVGRYVRLNISSTLSLIFGCSVFAVLGLTVNLICEVFGMPSPDGIWLKGMPFIGVSSAVLAIILILLYFSVFALFELRLPKEERWYSKIKAHFKKR
jgi:hypothetical protein